MPKLTKREAKSALKMARAQLSILRTHVQLLGQLADAEMFGAELSGRWTEYQHAKWALDDALRPIEGAVDAYRDERRRRDEERFGAPSTHVARRPSGFPTTGFVQVDELPLLPPGGGDVE